MLAIWNEVMKDTDNATSYFEEAIDIFYCRDSDTLVADQEAKLSLMRALKLGYTAVESCLLKSLNIRGDVEHGISYGPYELVRKAGSEIPNHKPAIISQKIQDLCFILIVFREFANLHQQAFTLECGTSPVRAASGLLVLLKPEIAAFIHQTS